MQPHAPFLAHELREDLGKPRGGEEDLQPRKLGLTSLLRNCMVSLERTLFPRISFKIVRPLPKPMRNKLMDKLGSEKMVFYRLGRDALVELYRDNLERVLSSVKIYARISMVRSLPLQIMERDLENPAHHMGGTTRY